MRQAVKAALACLALVALAGCMPWVSSEQRDLKKRYRLNEYPSNPVAGMKTVGLFVMDASPAEHPNLMDLTSLLHTQLQSVDGLTVLPDAAVAAVIAQGSPVTAPGAPTGARRPFVLPRDGLEVVDALGADGLFVAVVTDYNPYGEPVIAMGLILFSRKTAPLASHDMDRIKQGGRPLEMPDSPSQQPVTAVFDVYDVSQKTTRERIEMYAAGQLTGEAGLGWERYYRSMPNFMRFASYEIVWALFADLTMQKTTSGG